MFRESDSAIIGATFDVPMNTTEPSVSDIAATQDSQAEAQRLAEAFRLFSQASEELSSAYTALQTQVEQLTAELAEANGALRQQYQEKAALTERLALLLDALPAGVVVIGSDHRTMQANPAAERILGHAVPAGLIWPELERTSFIPTDVPGEYRIAGKQVAITVTALDSAGVHIVLLHDVSETHALKQHAERNQRLAAMGEMAAQLAHQLRTPLAAALLYAGNLELPSMADEIRVSIAGKTVSRLKHLERLIQDMLLFARGEVLGREAFAVGELIEEMRQTFEPLAQQRGIVFGTVASESDVALIGNRKAIAGALTNLLENAMDAAAGQVVLAMRATPSRVEFTVEDDGRGMSEDTLSRLFEPFFTTRAEGTGLGLAIARGVARAHGGGIDVTSSIGVGTRFLLHLQRAAMTAEQSTEQ